MLVAGAALALSARQAAADVTVNVGGADPSFLQAVGMDAATLQSTVQGQVDRLYNVSTAQRYLRSFADAHAFSSKGLGVDYASNAEIFVIGFGANFSLSVDPNIKPEDLKNAKAPVSSMAPNFSFLGGLNLGFLGLSPVTIFGNYFSRAGGYSPFDSKMKTMGAHVQLKLLGRPGHLLGLGPLFSWGGIDITTGYERNTLDLALRKPINSRFDLDDAAVPATIYLESTGTLAASMATTSVPLEITTNLQVLKLATVYGGFGFDWQTGDSTLNMNLNGDLTGEVKAFPDQVADLGMVNVSATEKTTPSAGRIRMLVGAQANILILRVFVQANALPSRGLYGIAFGGRVAW